MDGEDQRVYDARPNRSLSGRAFRSGRWYRQGTSIVITLTPEPLRAELEAYEGPTPPPTAQPTQKPTLTQLSVFNATVTPVRLSTMHPEQLQAMNPQQRREWYLAQLGRYENQVQESARNQGLPPQLLAVVILNELADINAIDVVQTGQLGGTLGYAQISQEGAIALKLFPGVTDKKRIRDLLNSPQHAIDAAAKVIRHLLQRMIIYQYRPWQQLFHFGGLLQLTDLHVPADVYKHIRRDLALQPRPPLGWDRLKEISMASMVAGAYNSSWIIEQEKAEAIDPLHPLSVEKHLRNALDHAAWAKMIAADLYDMKLFH